MKADLKKNHEAMKKWNEKRAESEKKALEKFYRLLSDPILHPSKFKQNDNR